MSSPFFYYNDLTDSEDYYYSEKKNSYSPYSSPSISFKYSQSPSFPSSSVTTSPSHTSPSSRVSSNNSIYTLYSKNNNSEDMHYYSNPSSSSPTFPSSSSLLSHNLTSPSPSEIGNEETSKTFTSSISSSVSSLTPPSAIPISSLNSPALFPPYSISSPLPANLNKINTTPQYLSANNSPVSLSPSSSTSFYPLASLPSTTYKCRQLPCRTFVSAGCCPYGDRCVFLHDPAIMSKNSYAKIKVNNSRKYFKIYIIIFLCFFYYMSE